MKYILRIVVISCFVFFSSCKNDDDGGAIRGVFVLTAIEIDTALDFDNDGIASNNLTDEIGCYLYQTILLGVKNSNGNNGISKHSIGAPVYRERIDVHSDTGITKLVTCIFNNSDVEFVWTRNGNTVDIASEDFNVTGILSEGDTKFEFVIEDGFTFQIVNDEGVEVEFTEDATYRYVR